MNITGQNNATIEESLTGVFSETDTSIVFDKPDAFLHSTIDQLNKQIVVDT